MTSFFRESQDVIGGYVVILAQGKQTVYRQRAFAQFILGVSGLRNAQKVRHLFLGQIVILPQFPDSLWIRYTVCLLLQKILTLPYHKSL